MSKTKFISHEAMQVYAECGYENNFNYPYGSRLIDVRTNNNNGFAAKVFMDEPTGQIVISFSGTDFSTKGVRYDLQNDLNMVVENIPSQAESAMKLYNEIKEKYPNVNIILTGHSLGGSLSQIIAKKTGATAVTFNAFSTGMDEGEDYSNITNIIDSQDFIAMSDVNTHPREIYVIPNDVGNILMPEFSLNFEHHDIKQMRLNNLQEYKRGSVKSFFDKIRTGERNEYLKIPMNSIKTIFGVWDSVREAANRVKKAANEVKNIRSSNISRDGNSPTGTGRVSNPITNQSGTRYKKNEGISETFNSSNSGVLYGHVSTDEGHWVTINGNHVFIED